MSFNKLSDQTMYTQIMRIHSFLFLDYCLLAVSQLLIKFQQSNLIIFTAYKLKKKQYSRRKAMGLNRNA